jgi:hypothetical protein
MDKEDIIRMAREAGISKPWDQEPVKWETLERFANLVAAAEREACVEEIEKIFQQEASMDTMREYVKRIIPYEKAIEAIRAGGRNNL